MSWSIIVQGSNQEEVAASIVEQAQRQLQYGCPTDAMQSLANQVRWLPKESGLGTANAPRVKNVGYITFAASGHEDFGSTYNVSPLCSITVELKVFPEKYPSK